MDSEPLRETIAHAQAGDARAYERLLAGYGPRLYGYFYRVTGRHHDAEDLLGEWTLRLVRTLTSYDHRGRFEPWLFRIAANLVRDRIRRSKTRPQPRSLSMGDSQGRSMVEDLPATAAGADANCLAKEASERLERALQTLDETTREMILLRHFGGLRFRELARRFDCPLGTALAKVHRGLRKLRIAMDETAE